MESQVAQNKRLLYPRVAHSSLEVAPNYWLLAFQVMFLGFRGTVSDSKQQAGRLGGHLSLLLSVLFRLALARAPI